MRRGLILATSAVLIASGCGDGDQDAGRARPSPSPAENPSPAVTPDLSRFAGRLVQVATVTQPIALATRAGDASLYVAQKTGQVVAIRDGRVANRPLVDLSAEVSQGGEQGLLGLTFSPDGAFMYVNYTDLEGDTHVTEFGISATGGVEPGSRRDVLFVDQPYSNHNGGQVAFGPDGFLYIGLGDGGSGGDPQDNAQNLDSLLGKVLRISPRPSGSAPYGIPADNPFVGRDDARPEVWLYGLRNPWRFSFDRLTGNLWIGDAGQDRREEIDRHLGPSGGQNFGWDGYEGTLVYEEPVPENAVDPVYEYPDQGASAVIGGYVYRGSRLPALQGAYVFGDFFDPALRALVRGDDGYEAIPLDLTVPNLSAFAEDAAGELYALSLSGQVYLLAP